MACSRALMWRTRYSLFLEVTRSLIVYAVRCSYVIQKQAFWLVQICEVPKMYIALGSLLPYRVSVRSSAHLLSRPDLVCLLSWSPSLSLCLSRMREIVHLQAGQCGNQIGSKVCWSSAGKTVNIIVASSHVWEVTDSNTPLGVLVYAFLIC